MFLHSQSARATETVLVSPETTSDGDHLQLSYSAQFCNLYWEEVCVTFLAFVVSLFLYARSIVQKRMFLWSLKFSS